MFLRFIVIIVVRFKVLLLAELCAVTGIILFPLDAKLVVEAVRMERQGIDGAAQCLRERLCVC